MDYEMVMQYINQYIEKFKPYKSGTWCYEDGILLTGLWSLYQVTGSEKYLQFINGYLDKSISPEGLPEDYEATQYNIDNINPGRLLFDIYNLTGREKYLKTIHLLYQQLERHPRTHNGSFWHKGRYPYQIWLDGLYMAQPFYTRYLKEIKKTTDYSDILNQYRNVRKCLFDRGKKLYCHAWDETKSMPWAEAATGRSPNIWGRSVGWYAMSLVDVAEIAGEESDLEKLLVEYLNELVEGMAVHQTDKGLWLQVVDKPDSPGNYPETSGTLMMAYTLLKGARLGYLEKRYRLLGLKAFEGTVENYLQKKGAGLHLGGTCQVAGLDDKGRDGSIAYYLSEPVVEDEAKGVAPLMMAYSEILRIEKE